MWNAVAIASHLTGMKTRCRLPGTTFRRLDGGQTCTLRARYSGPLNKAVSRPSVQGDDEDVCPGCLDVFHTQKTLYSRRGLKTTLNSTCRDFRHPGYIAVPPWRQTHRMLACLSVGRIAVCADLWASHSAKTGITVVWNLALSDHLFQTNTCDPLPSTVAVCSSSFRSPSPYDAS